MIGKVEIGRESALKKLGKVQGFEIKVARLIGNSQKEPFGLRGLGLFHRLVRGFLGGGRIGVLLRAETVVFDERFQLVDEQFRRFVLAQRNGSVHEDALIRHDEVRILRELRRKDHALDFCKAVFEFKERHTTVILGGLERDRRNHSRHAKRCFIGRRIFLVHHRRDLVGVQKCEVFGVSVKEVAREVKPGRLFFHHELFAHAELGQFGVLGFGYKIGGCGRKHIELPRKIVLTALGGKVDHLFIDRKHLTAIDAETVKGAGFEKRLNHAFVQLPGRHPIDEIRERNEATVTALGKQFFEELFAHVFDRKKSEANILSADREIGSAFVDVGRQDLNAARGALGNIFGDLCLVAKYAGKQRGKIGARVMAF